MSPYIYFIKVLREDGPVKIGCSTEPMSRLVSLSTWCPYPTEVAATVPGGFDLERQIQNCFADLHLHREWFRPDARLVGAIARLKAGLPLSEAVDLSDVRGDIRADQYARRSAGIALKKLRAKTAPAMERAS